MFLCVGDVWWMNRTPLGRLISRFSKDFRTIDMNLPAHMQFMMNQTTTFISVVIVVSLADWWMTALMVPLGLFFLLFHITNIWRIGRFIHEWCDCVDKSDHILCKAEEIQTNCDSSTSYGRCDSFSDLRSLRQHPDGSHVHPSLQMCSTFRGRVPFLHWRKCTNFPVNFPVDTMVCWETRLVGKLHTRHHCGIAHGWQVLDIPQHRVSKSGSVQHGADHTSTVWRE